MKIHELVQVAQGGGQRGQSVTICVEDLEVQEVTNGVGERGQLTVVNVKDREARQLTKCVREGSDRIVPWQMRWKRGKRSPIKTTKSKQIH